MRCERLHWIDRFSPSHATRLKNSPAEKKFMLVKKRKQKEAKSSEMETDREKEREREIERESERERWSDLQLVVIILSTR